MKYSIICTCGDLISVDAQTRDEAVERMEEMMTPEAIDAHFADNHPGEIPPSKEEMGIMIEQQLMQRPQIIHM
ncbi:MAG: hypothetical protein ACM3IJ_05585 [Candidatus Levyibacteriota bacterium]